jgi:hypothetical protein
VGLRDGLDTEVRGKSFAFAGIEPQLSSLNSAVDMISITSKPTIGIYKLE